MSYGVFKSAVDESLHANTVVVGSLGSGAGFFVENFIKELEQHKNNTDVQYIKYRGEIGSEPLNAYSTVHITRVYSLSAAFEKVLSSIEERLALLDKKNCSNIQEYNSLADRHLQAKVFIITKFDVLLKRCKDVSAAERTWQDILEQGEKTGVSLMVVQSHTALEVIPYVKNFPVRICYYCDEQVSRELLGSDIAHTLIPRGNEVYKYNSTKPELGILKCSLTA